MPGVAITALTDDSDAVAVGSIGAVSLSRLTGFNGSTYDRIRTLGASSLDGLGQMAISTAIPGASVVKMFRREADPGTTRATIITPTSGKRLRVTSVQWTNQGSGGAGEVELYFGTGANIDSTPANAITQFGCTASTNQNVFNSWPDGTGPAGAVDAVLSYRHQAAGIDAQRLVIVYREE